MLRMPARRHNVSNARFDVPRLQRRPVLRREHQTKCVAPCDLCVAQLTKPMPPQDRHELLRQRYGGRGRLCLHKLVTRVFSHARKRLRDNYPSVDQVHVDPAKPGCLPTPQTDGQRDRPQRIEPVVTRRFEKCASFLRGLRHHLANRAGRHLDCRATFWANSSSSTASCSAARTSRTRYRSVPVPATCPQHSAGTFAQHRALPFVARSVDWNPFALQIF